MLFNPLALLFALPFILAGAFMLLIWTNYATSRLKTHLPR